MHGAIRAAGYSLMTLFVSCRVGAEDVASSAKTHFSATAQEARAIARQAPLPTDNGKCRCSNSPDNDRQAVDEVT
ncbi:hypothetical protein [Pseudomonas sp. PB3P13]